MRNLVIVILTIVSNVLIAQDIREALAGEYVGYRDHFKTGGTLEYTVDDTIYVYKSTLADKIHIRYEKYDSYDDLLEYESKHPENLYLLNPIDSTFESDNIYYFQSGNFYDSTEISIYDYFRNGDGVVDRYYCSKIRDITLGVTEYPKKRHLSLYPNPTSGELHVLGNQTKSFTIKNASGKTITQGIYKERIDMSHYSNGLYYVIFDNQVKKVFKK